MTTDSSDAYALSGETLEGRYRLGDPLGRGGTAEVYRGTQLVLGRTVAVKVLRAPSSTAKGTQVLQRFFREATSLARLTHPNTVRVFDAGTHQGRPYLVMEYVRGRALRGLCKDGPLDPLNAVRLCRQVAGALVEAHALELVHRDLKPSNVLVSRGHDQQDEARVIDFGLVRDRASTLDLTRAGELMGTPMYMAPEVAAGRSAGVAADIYDLGITLYQALTGRPPFSRRGGAVAVMQRVLNEPMIPLERAAPSLQLPPILKWVLDSCLAKKASDRFRDMRALEEALHVCEVALHHQTIPADPATMGPQSAQASPPHAMAQG